MQVYSTFCNIVVALPFTALGYHSCHSQRCFCVIPKGSSRRYLRHPSLPDSAIGVCRRVFYRLRQASLYAWGQGVYSLACHNSPAWCPVLLSALRHARVCPRL
jgi:hypothetical protein